MDASGRLVDKTDLAIAKNHTCIEGVKLQNTAVGEQAIAYQPEIETVTQPSGPVVATLPATPAKEQLSAAIQILTALEKNGVLGVIDSIDVTALAELTLEYDGRYQVNLGDTSRLEYKIGAMKASVAKMGQYQSGHLDVSFTIWPDEVGYRPFEDTSSKK